MEIMWDRRTRLDALKKLLEGKSNEIAERLLVGMERRAPYLVHPDLLVDLGLMSRKAHLGNQFDDYQFTPEGAEFVRPYGK